MILSHLPLMLPFDMKDMENVALAAKEDGHGVFLPTETVIKEGRIVGWISQGAAPVVLTWLSSRRIDVRDTLQLWQTVEGVQRRLGAPGVLIPCKEESPLHPLMEKVGYNNLGNYNLFYKKF